LRCLLGRPPDMLIVKLPHFHPRTVSDVALTMVYFGRIASYSQASTPITMPKSPTADLGAPRQLPRAGAGQSHMSKPYPKPRPQSGTTLVVLVGAGPGSPKNADAFFGVPRKPALVRHSRSVRLIRAWRTNFDCAADDGNSLAARLGHKGGFKTRPYKLRALDVPPVH